MGEHLICGDSFMVTQRIETILLLIRGRRVILDIHLASLYGTTTKRLKQQIKRNRQRFPEDFMFELTEAEKNEVVTVCDHLERLKYSGVLPLAFTEHGVVMVANVLRSDRAVEISVLVVRAFIRMRELLSSHKELLHKVNQLEMKYDSQFKVVFNAIRELMTPPTKTRKRIGF